MQIIKTKLPQVYLIEPKVHQDSRGFFMEAYREAFYREAGINERFVQDNLSSSGPDVLRGMHYQLQYPQGKLLSVIRGKILDVIVDLRQGSPTFGEWVAVELSGENKKQVYVPPGMAHGYCTLSPEVIVYYKCTDYYHPEDEYSVLWSDKDLAIEWPLTTTPIISSKDLAAPTLAAIPASKLPVYQP